MYALNADQEFVVSRAIDWFLHSSEQVFQYDGPPGSGKSVVLNEIVRRLGLDIGTEIAPMSFIGAASLIMRTKGLYSAKTAHSWIYDLVEVPKRDANGNIMYSKKDGKMITQKMFRPKPSLGANIKLIIIDEAYCMPLSMRPIIERYGIKILACGDSHQLPPVKDRPAFLISGKIFHLNQVMRQFGRDDIIFIANRAMNRLPLLNGFYGNSMVIDKADLTDDMLLWADVVICGTNRTRDILNNHIRYLRGFTGLLPNYGERIVCRNNNWDISAVDFTGNTINLVNGLIGTVVNQPSIDSFNPKKNTFQLSFLCDITSSRFDCEASYDYMVANHETRELVKENMYITNPLFEFAYAITCHIAQGSQFGKVLYIEEPLNENINGCLNLVGATRAVRQLIYVNGAGRNWRTYNDPIYDLNSDQTYQHVQAMKNKQLIERQQRAIKRREAAEEKPKEKPKKKQDDDESILLRQPKKSHKRYYQKKRPELM